MKPTTLAGPFLILLCLGLVLLRPDSQSLPSNIGAEPIPTPLPKLNLPALARQALEYYFATGQRLELDPARLPTEWHRDAGLFVTLSYQGQPRGCWGSLRSTATNLAEATIQAAIGAASRDWRYPPLQAGELDKITIQVAVIQAILPITNLNQIDPTQSGLWIRSGVKGAVLLPGEALTTAWQVSTARRLAGLSPQEPIDLFKVEAELLYEF